MALCFCTRHGFSLPHLLRTRLRHRRTETWQLWDFHPVSAQLSPFLRGTSNRAKTTQAMQSETTRFAHTRQRVCVRYLSPTIPAKKKKRSLRLRVADPPPYLCRQTLAWCTRATNTDPGSFSTTRNGRADEAGGSQKPECSHMRACTVNPFFLSTWLTECHHGPVPTSCRCRSSSLATSWPF